MSQDTAAATATENENFSDDKFDAATLRGIRSFEDAFAAAERVHGQVVDASDEMGDGFITVSKDSLIGKPFIILNVMFPESDREDADGQKLHFAVVRAVTEDNDKVVFSDGGTGIYKTLRDYCNEKNVTGGMIVKGGLRVSEYQYKDPRTGRKQPAKTYYLNV